MDIVEQIGGRPGRVYSTIHWNTTPSEIPPEGFGPRGAKTNARMLVDWVRFYPLKAIIEERFDERGTGLMTRTWAGTHGSVIEITFEIESPARKEAAFEIVVNGETHPILKLRVKPDGLLSASRRP